MYIHLICAILPPTGYMISQFTMNVKFFLLEGYMGDHKRREKRRTSFHLINTVSSTSSYEYDMHVYLSYLVDSKWISQTNIFFAQVIHFVLSMINHWNLIQRFHLSYGIPFSSRSDFINSFSYEFVFFICFSICVRSNSFLPCFNPPLAQYFIISIHFTFFKDNTI